jgi:hypothetical protein
MHLFIKMASFWTEKRRNYNKQMHVNWIFVLFTQHSTRWFKYDRDYLCVNKSQFVPVIFEPPCTSKLIRIGNLDYFSLDWERNG